MEKSAALREYAKYLWKLAAEVEAEEGGPMGIGAHTGLGALGGAALGTGAGLGALALLRGKGGVLKSLAANKGLAGRAYGVAQPALATGAKAVDDLANAMARQGQEMQWTHGVDAANPNILQRILRSVRTNTGKSLDAVANNQSAMMGGVGGLTGAGLGGLAGLGTGIGRNYGEE